MCIRDRGSYAKSKTFTYDITIQANGTGIIATSSLDTTNFVASSSNASQVWEVTSSSWSSKYRLFTQQISQQGSNTIINFVSTSPTSTQENLNPLNVQEWDEMGVNVNQSYSIKFEEMTGYYRLEGELYTKEVTLPWFNCYSFGNGLESDRIRDDFNAPTIDNGVKVSTGLDTYGEEYRSSGMIYSGIYNSTSGVNNLNEFNMAESITKDLNPIYLSLIHI